ncbi:hypothetical protein JCM10212_005785, partial [Sporobolomyces blumeae]
LYSQLLLFSSSASPPNPSTLELDGLDSNARRKVKMVARMLGLGYGTEDLSGAGGFGGMRVMLWKTGYGGAPSQPLRSTASASYLRRPASTSSFHSTPTASSSFAPPPVPALPAFSSYLHTNSALNPNPLLRGKKSMPEFRPSSASFYSTAADEPLPPLPSSASFASFAPTRTHSNGIASHRSTTNLRDAQDSASSLSPSPSSYQPSYSSKTFSGFYEPSSSTSSPFTGSVPVASRRTREIPSVQGLFQQQGILPDPASPASDEAKKEFCSIGLGQGARGGRADAVRQPKGPGVVGAGLDAGQDGDPSALDWRARRRM